MAGRYGLPKTYWFFGVLGSFLFNIPVALALTAGSQTAVILVGIISCMYLGAVLVGIWRASELYKGPKIWAGLAKLAVILGCISFSVSLVGLAIA